MWRIGVVGNFESAFFESAQKIFRAAKPVIESFGSGVRYDAVLVLPDAILPADQVSCKILIIPEDTIINNALAKSVVSYGMSQRNTVTLSSTQDADHIVALQRDVAALEGTLVLRQEFSFSCSLPPYETLALASLMIITGELD